MTLPSPASVLLSGNVASILADPVRDRIYISHGTWGSILVWNTSSDSLQANVSVGMGPGRMGFSWTGNELFVGLGPDRSLAVVDLSTLSLLKTIPLQVSPVDVAGGRPGRAYVTTTEGCGCPQIVDTEKGAVIGAIRAAGAIYYGGFARTTLDRSILFVATPWLDPSTIYAFDVRTDNVTLRGQSPFDSVGENLNDFRVAPTEPWLFVTSGWPYYVQVIDYRTWTSVRQLATGPYPSNVDLAQRGRLAFAAHGFNDVMGFNTTDGTSLGTVSFSQDVKAVAVSHDGTRVFVITTDIYGGSRQLEEASTGLTPPPPGPPVAFGFADREFAYVPAEFTFRGGAAFGTPPYRFRWDFDDGATNASWTASHVYSTVGSHTARLTAVDAAGYAANASISVYAGRPPLPNPLSIGSLFPGLMFSIRSNFVVPPDVQVAVGPDHIMEMVNIRFGIWSRDGTLLKEDSLVKFFGKPEQTFLTDPRVQFDAVTGRWFATVFDVDDSAVLLEVSNGPDPTDGWHRVSVSAPGCPDQPILGVGPLTVVISVNLFESCVGAEVFSGAMYWVLNKTDLLENRTPRFESFGPFPDQASAHPVQVIGSSGPMYLVSVGWADVPTTTLQMSLIRGSPPNLEPVINSQVAIRTVNRPPSVAQRDTMQLVDTGDARVQDAVVDNGSLWITFADACSPEGSSLNQSCARVLQVDATTGALIQDFDMGDRVRGYFYPALRLDGSGNLIVVFGYSSPSDHPGVMVAAQLTTDPRNTIRAPITVQTGSAPEALWCPGTTCRYGDYFGAANDPIDPEAIWVAGEYGALSGWHTAVGPVGLFQTVDLTLHYAVPNGGAPASAPLLTYISKAQRVQVPLGSEPRTFEADLGTAWGLTTSIAGRPGERWILAGPDAGTASGPRDMTADYDHQYQVAIDAEPSAGGTIAPVSGWYSAGRAIRLTATPTSGWAFGGWTGNGTGAYSGTSMATDVVVNDSISESATFLPGLQIDASTGGTVAYFYGSTTGLVPAGTSATLHVPIGTVISLVAQPGYPNKFNGWSGDLAGPGGFASVTVLHPTRVSAIFATDIAALGMTAGIPLAAVVFAAVAIVVGRGRRRRPRAPNQAQPESPSPPSNEGPTRR